MTDEYNKIINKIGPKIQQLIDSNLEEKQPPLFLFGVIMVILADQFKRFNYSFEDYCNFLEYSKSIWDFEDPKPSKPKLTLIKNENYSANITDDS